MKVRLAVEQLRRGVPGGIGTYATGLLDGIRRLPAGDRPDVELVASRSPVRPDPLAGHGFPVAAVPVPGPLLTRLWDLGLLGVGGADVVHSVSLAAPPVRRPARAVVTVHDLAWRTVPDAFPPRGRRWHEAALGRALRRADLLVAPSQQTADELRAAGARRVAVVGEGWDHLPAPDDQAASALLARLGVADGFLLSVSTLEPRKNLGRLLAAYRRARPRLPEPWPLVVVGPRGWGEDVVPVDGAVLAGAVSGGVLAALYRRARCLAFVPLTEGFGLPALEAMSAGLPVVASPMPSTGGAALEVDPVDVEAIAHALVVASGSGGERDRLGEAGLRHAAPLTWEASARRHVEAWRSLA
ncbi:MAG TPA: glycosyltransferase family 1 protein [Acidimicrobiales bacterium]|nr:glycosyltransferase family 1 protein [Acidimicrobiales bacterium]